MKHEYAGHRKEILTVADRYGVRNIRIFGSAARGEARGESDLDLLVELEPGRSLFDLGGFAIDLEERLGRRIDAQTAAGLHWSIRDQILKEAIPL